MSAGDPYVYEGTDVLRNRAGLRDPTLLAQVEQQDSARALLEMRREPPLGQFDLAHYQAVHRRLVGDIYEWAGQPRTIDLWKPEIALRGHSVEYAPAADIEPQSKLALAAFGRLPPGDLTEGRPALALGQAMTALWQTHPFREGNTRTLFAFVEQFARHRHQSLDQEIINRVPSETRDALVQATQGIYRPLTHMIQSARIAEIERMHPVLGRLSSDAREVLELLGSPRVQIAEPGVTVQGQVLATSYRHALLRTARNVLAIPLEAFPQPPENNQRIEIRVPAPGESMAPQARQARGQEQDAPMRVLGGVLIPAAALALGREALPTLKPQSEIPLPSPALSEALKTRAPQEILRDPDLAREAHKIDEALVERFGPAKAAVVIQGEPDTARSLLPSGADLAAIRAILVPVREIVLTAEIRSAAKERIQANELGSSGQERSL